MGLARTRGSQAPCTREVLIEPITPERFQSAYRLRLRYSDKPGISFTDLTSFTVMQDLVIQHVLTGDDHFVQAQLGFRKLPE